MIASGLLGAVFVCAHHERCVARRSVEFQSEPAAEIVPLMLSDALNRQGPSCCAGCARFLWSERPVTLRLAAVTIRGDFVAEHRRVDL